MTSVVKKMVFTGVMASWMVAMSLGIAHATYYTNTFQVSVWNGNTTTKYATLPTPSATPFATFTYTGPIDFVNENGQSGTNTFGEFFGSHSGGISNFTSADTFTQFLDTTMSTPGETYNSYLAFNFNFNGTGTVSVTHDDGASLYNANGSLFTSPGPTSAITSTAFVPFISGSGNVEPLTLVYVESNGAPAVLTMTATPEPSTWLLFATGLAGLLFFGKKKMSFRNVENQI